MPGCWLPPAYTSPRITRCCWRKLQVRSHEGVREELFRAQRFAHWLRRRLERQPIRGQGAPPRSRPSSPLPFMPCRCLRDGAYTKASRRTRKNARGAFFCAVVPGLLANGPPASQARTHTCPGLPACCCTDSDSAVPAADVADGSQEHGTHALAQGHASPSAVNSGRSRKRRKTPI